MKKSYTIHSVRLREVVQCLCPVSSLLRSCVLRWRARTSVNSHRKKCRRCSRTPARPDKNCAASCPGNTISAGRTRGKYGNLYTIRGVLVLGGSVEEGGGAGMVCSDVRRGDVGRGVVGLLRSSEQLQCS